MPVPVLLLAIVAVAFFALPFLGLLWRMPWGVAGTIASDDAVRTALWLSIRTSLTATALAVLFGVPLAWLLARVAFRGRGAVRALCMLSMVLPPVVGGVVLFFSFGRRGLFGQYLDRWFDFRLPFTTWGVVMAQTFVSMPFLVITVEAALRQVDRRYEDAARTLGGSRWYVFRRVTLPTIRPALVAGAVLAWARALGRVRGHDHLRRQLPRDHPDDAAGDVSRARDRPAGGAGAQPGPGRDLVRGARQPPRSLARRVQPGGRSAMTLAGLARRRCRPRSISTSSSTVAPGEVLAVLGPNGAGKTTLLRSIAGLPALDRGQVRSMARCSTIPAADVFVPAERRPIGVVFQSTSCSTTSRRSRTWRSGSGPRGCDKADARGARSDWLDAGRARRVRRRPAAALSGGQAQRVALARALAIEPRVLLLDEPLAALDVQTRREVRRDLREHLASFDGMRLLVTHDPVDAYALADRVAILDGGRIVQAGTIAEVTAHPRSRYVAELVGTNLVAGDVADGVLTSDGGAQVVVADADPGRSFAVIRPQAVTIAGPITVGHERAQHVARGGA